MLGGPNGRHRVVDGNHRVSALLMLYNELLQDRNRAHLAQTLRFVPACVLYSDVPENQLKILGAELNIQANTHVVPSFIMEAEQIHKISMDRTSYENYVDMYCNEHEAEHPNREKMKADSTMSQVLAKYIMFDVPKSEAKKDPVPGEKHPALPAEARLPPPESDQGSVGAAERRRKDISMVLGIWTLSKFRELRVLIEMEKAQDFDLGIGKRYLLNRCSEFRTLITKAVDFREWYNKQRSQGERPIDVNAEQWVVEAFRLLFDVTATVRSGDGQHLAERIKGVPFPPDKDFEEYEKWLLTESVVGSLVRPFTNAMLIWTTTAQNPKLEGWIDMRADEALVSQLKKITTDFDALRNRPPAFLTSATERVGTREVPTIIKAFLAAHNKQAGLPQAVDLEDDLATGQKEMADAQAAKKKERKDRKRAAAEAKQRMEIAEEEAEEDEEPSPQKGHTSELARLRAQIAQYERQEASGAGPGPAPTPERARTAREAAVVVSEGEEERAPAPADEEASVTPVPAASEVTHEMTAHGKEKILREFVTTELSQVLRRPILDADFKIIRNDRVQLQACNICQEAVIVPVPHYMHELREKPDLSTDFQTFSRCFPVDTVFPDEDSRPATTRPTIDNSGMFIIPKAGKTVAVLDDMFLSTNEYGKYLRRAKLIFANPPWGIWRGKDDEPLTEKEIQEFAQCFRRIVDSRGAVVIQPGPSTSHVDAWSKAMDEAGFAMCRSPWYAECVWKRPRPLYHTSPPTMYTLLYVFYVKNSEKVPTAPGISWNKGIANEVCSDDFHRRPILRYRRLREEKVTGPGARNQSNSLVLLSRLVQLYVFRLGYVLGGYNVPSLVMACVQVPSLVMVCVGVPSLVMALFYGYFYYVTQVHQARRDRSGPVLRGWDHLSRGDAAGPAGGRIGYRSELYDCLQDGVQAHLRHLLS